MNDGMLSEFHACDYDLCVCPQDSGMESIMTDKECAGRHILREALRQSDLTYCDELPA